MKIGRISIQVRQYADGRWGFDDYSSGKRVMVRLLSKEKAVARLKAERQQIDPAEMKEFLRWKSNRTTPHPPCNDGRLRRNGMPEAERLVWEHVSSWEDSEILKCGWPDFLVAHAGSIYCLEVKTGNDPIRDKQKRVHEILRKAGIETFIVRDGWCEELQKRFAPSRLTPVKGQDLSP
jgi:hypothetical protein